MNKILTSLAVLSVLVAGCTATGGLNLPKTPSALATDVNILATGLQPIGMDVAAIPGIDPKIVAQINADIALVKKDSALIASSTAANPPTSIVQEIVTTVQALAAVATPVIPGGTATVVAIDAATSLAEVLLQEAGVTMVGHDAVAPKYTKAQAELILAGTAAKYDAAK